MLVPLRFKDKNGFYRERDGADVLWAVSAGQHCILYFSKTDYEYWSYPLKEFHRRVWDINCFRRLDRFLLVKVLRIKRRISRKAQFYNEIILDLSRQANKRLKACLKKHPPLAE